MGHDHTFDHVFISAVAYAGCPPPDTSDESHGLAVALDAIYLLIGLLLQDIRNIVLYCVLLGIAVFFY